MSFPDKKEVSRALSLFKRENRYSQHDLAQMTGLAQTTISNILSNSHHAMVETTARTLFDKLPLAKYLPDEPVSKEVNYDLMTDIYEGINAAMQDNNVSLSRQQISALAKAIHSIVRDTDQPVTPDICNSLIGLSNNFKARQN